MADTYDLKKITDFTAKAAVENADLFLIGDNGTATLKRITFDAIMSTIRSMYGLNDLQRDIVGAGSFDLNNISDGWHQIDATLQPSNMPVSANTGIIFQASNTRGNGNKYQLYAYTMGSQLWHRVCWYGAWSPWFMMGGKAQATITVGNSNAMTMHVNSSLMDGSVMYINCAVRFTGSVSAGATLITLPNTVSKTQYLTVCKSSASNLFISNVGGGSANVGCPTSFASGDVAYITGTIAY